MRHLSTLTLMVFLVGSVGLYTSSALAWTPYADHVGVDVSTANLESLFGPSVQSLNARVDRSFGFTSTHNRFLNSNLTSMVFQADEQVNLGDITLNIGDYTFAYLIDLTNNPFLPDGALDDFQLNAFSDLMSPNPQELIALSEVKGGGYSTNSEFGPNNANYLQSYPVNTSWESSSWLNGEFANQVQYDWPVSHPEYDGIPEGEEESGFLQPRDKALIFLFTTPFISIREIGAGAGLEGAVFQGSGDTVEEIPALVPTAVPEPATLVLSAGFMAFFYLPRVRKCGRK